MSEETQLAVVPPKETALAVFSTANGLEPWLQQVRVKVDEFQKILPDLKTKKGRDAYASMAHQIAKSKTALEAVGKEISAQQKEIPKKIDAERKRVWDILESWQKEVRKPLDDWQAAEDQRVTAHNDGIQQIKDLAMFAETPTAAFVAQVIADLELVSLDDSWEEYLPEAAQAKDKSLAALRALLVTRQEYEKEQAELAKLREEKEARDKKDAEDRIASEAAAQATLQAEAKARDEKAAAEKREADLKLAAAESERKAEQAKREQIEAEQKAEADRLAAIERQKEAVEQARLDEVARQEAEAAELKRQADAREADLEHKKSINRAALEAFVAGGMTEECAKQAVTLIAQRKIPAVTISY